MIMHRVNSFSDNGMRILNVKLCADCLKMVVPKFVLCIMKALVSCTLRFFIYLFIFLFFSFHCCFDFSCWPISAYTKTKSQVEEME